MTLGFVGEILGLRLKLGPPDPTTNERLQFADRLNIEAMLKDSILGWDD